MSANQAALESRAARYTPERRYRPDLHGIRGLAILGVVLFHLFGNGRVSGGIDIFLTVSGFLFTAMLLREAAEYNGRINFLAYFGRLFRRIFAPAAIVVIVTAIAGMIILPFTQHTQMLGEAVASLLYYENIELINSQLSYDAAGPDTSMFQHFWSLSVQGQFYLVIPFVILALVWVARKRNHPAVFWVGTVLVVVFIASMAWAIIYGAQLQDEAYLATSTRLWQLAFGGLLAIVIDHLRLAAGLRLVLGWLGLFMVVSTGFLFDGGQQFPGPLALWPLLGLAFVLLAAPQDGTAGRGTVTHLLDNKIFNWIGDYSYALYLWHWPLLILYLAIRDREAIGIRGGIVILAVAILLSLALNHLVERPIQSWGRTATGQKGNTIPLAIGLVVMLVFSNVVSNHLLTAQQEADQQEESGYELDPEQYPGAMATVDDELDVPQVETYEPYGEELASVQQDYVTKDCRQDGENEPGSYEVTLCEDPEAPENPSATVVLAPDSHAGHWEQTFRTLGREHNWEVKLAIKSGCNFSGVPNEPGNNYCHMWNDNFAQYLETEDVDLVVAPGTQMYSRPAEEGFADGAQDRWEQIAETDTPLLLIRGVIRPGGTSGTADCLASGDDPADCGGMVGDAYDPNPIEDEDLAETTHTIDMNPYVCPGIENGPDTACSAVVGNVAVWYDNSHITPQYATTLAPIMEDQIQELYPELFTL